MDERCKSDLHSIHNFVRRLHNEVLSGRNR